MNETGKVRAERDAGHKYKDKDKDMRKVKSQEGSAAGAQPVESPGTSQGASPGEALGTSPGASLGESPGESPGRSRGTTKNEKRLSGMQATETVNMEFRNEILESEMPEILKIGFLEEKLI